jgi:hypothetical protein
MGVSPPLFIPFRPNQHVLAERGEVLAAKGAAVGRRLQVLGRL